MRAHLRVILAVLAGGLASAGLALSVETGSLLRLLLLGLSPLPLFACGLSAGMLTCLAAGLTAAKCKGAQIYLSAGGTGGVECVAFSNGTNWRQIAIGANCI